MALGLFPLIWEANSAGTRPLPPLHPHPPKSLQHISMCAPWAISSCNQLPSHGNQGECSSMRWSVWWSRVFEVQEKSLLCSQVLETED